MIDTDLEPVTIKKPLKTYLTPDSTPRRSALTVAGYCLLALALLYTLYFAKSLLIPIVVALFFSLLLSPLVTLFKRFYIPRAVSAILLLTMIGGPVTILAIELAGPSQKWLSELPQLSAHLTEELDDISLAMSPEVASVKVKSLPPKEKSSGLFGFFSSDAEPEAAQEQVIQEPITPGKSALSARVMQGGIEIIVSLLGRAPVVIAQFITFIILVLFLLIFGPGLYNNYLLIFPSGADKRRSVDLVGKVQKELSRYIITISIINMGLGMVTAGVFWFMGVNDALLWGALVALLNFAPFVGPIIAIAILSLAGISQYGMELVALIPAGVFFGINLLEAQFITPAVLGRHMRVNPLILIIWLLIWGWLWGPMGVLLAVPLFVCIKLATGQLTKMAPWVALIETSD
ncbi:MAG: putative PurR-regulated permease PerM [Psychromonas sp.]|jgi:predicted PurR-regulated permease PerM|uniref:AI-2E family transporter n=1 Tax=Psychromonas sp. TaxID=1884585 RepID=UPI0039E51CFC